MPRNKAAKRTNKSQTMSKTLVSVQKMEKDFLQMPSQMAAQLNKEVNAHKQQEAKLKNALTKIKSTMKNAELRVKATLKNKHTSAGKKQLSTAKKIHAEAVKLHSDLNNQLQAASKVLTSLTSKHSKLTALGKYLSQFEKEWSKSSKKANIKSKARTKPKAKKKIKTEATIIQMPQQQAVEPAFDDLRHNEPTELAS